MLKTFLRSFRSREETSVTGVECWSVRWTSVQGLYFNEKKEVAELMAKFGNAANLVLDVYKNRRGSMSAIKIFRKFDYGTCHAKDLFITDDSYHPWENQNGLKAGVVTFKENLYDKVIDIPAEVMLNA